MDMHGKGRRKRKRKMDMHGPEKKNEWSICMGLKDGKETGRWICS